MSQAKVDQYKEYKKNRKSQIAKEKSQKKLVSLITTIVIAVLAIGLVVGIVITVKNAVPKAADSPYKAEAFLEEDFVGIRSTGEAAETVEE